MVNRKDNLLKNIIGEHLRTAEPVGSKLLVDKLDVSSATIRNEMVELENEGLIHQPHTSAGRVPTEKAYKYYLDKFFKPRKVQDAQRKSLLEIKKGIEKNQQAKQIAKNLAGLCQETVYVAFDKNNFFYTGISFLFHQPEFCDIKLVLSLTDIIDQLDEIINRNYNVLQKKLQVLVGSDNPFLDNGSTIVGAFEWQGEKGVLGVLGPMRMNYEENYSLVDTVLNHFDNLN